VSPGEDFGDPLVARPRQGDSMTAQRIADDLDNPGADGRFRIIRVRWPDGGDYYAVRPADTEARVRSRLRTAVRCGDPSPLACAARYWGVENAEVTLVGAHSEEAPALEVANGLIDALPAHRRLNVRRLYPNRNRRAAARDEPWTPPDLT
jgi:hypothetical protein